MYEYLHFSIFIMIYFVANGYDSKTYLEYVLCLYKQWLIKTFWEVMSFQFLATIDEHESKRSL